MRGVKEVMLVALGVDRRGLWVIAFIAMVLSGCIEEPLGIAYRVGGTTYIEAPCGGLISTLEV
jgi:hypothetical protein